MINRPQRHSNVAPFPTTIPHLKNTPTGFRRHCLYRMGILKSFEDKIVAHDFFRKTRPCTGTPVSTGCSRCAPFEYTTTCQHSSGYSYRANIAWGYQLSRCARCPDNRQNTSYLLVWLEKTIPACSIPTPEGNKPRERCNGNHGRLLERDGYDSRVSVATS